MKDYYIDFQGYCRLEASSIEEVREKFYNSFHGSELKVKDLNLEISCIEEVEEEE